jgi:6-phosphogluconolactonase
MPGTFRYGLLALLPAITMVAATMMVSTTRAATFVYVGSAESNEIYVLQLDRQSGDLTVAEKVLIPGITKPGASTPMAVSPDRRFLYVGTRGEPQIAAGFAIDSSSGKLKHVANGPLADSMAYISLDRTGRFLLGASYPGHNRREPDRAAGYCAAVAASVAESSKRTLDPCRCGKPLCAGTHLR